MTKILCLCSCADRDNFILHITLNITGNKTNQILSMPLLQNTTVKNVYAFIKDKLNIDRTDIILSRNVDFKTVGIKT